MLLLTENHYHQLQVRRYIQIMLMLLMGEMFTKFLSEIMGRDCSEGQNTFPRIVEEGLLICGGCFKKLTEKKVHQ
jgi:hypothetical protein